MSQVTTPSPLANKRVSLKISILQASDIAKKDLFGQHNPYCKVWINEGLQEQSTAVKRKTMSPYWGEEFTFSVNPSKDVVHLMVYDHNRLKRDDFIGLAELDLKLCDIPGPNQPMKLERLDLSHRKEKYHKNNRVTGRLSIKVQYQSNDSNQVDTPSVASINDNVPNVNIASESASGSNEGSQSVPEQEAPLPEGWEKRIDQNDRKYYVDHHTKTTTWVRPTLNSLRDIRRQHTQTQNQDKVSFQQRETFSNNNDHRPSTTSTDNIPTASTTATTTSCTSTLASSSNAPSSISDDDLTNKGAESETTTEAAATGRNTNPSIMYSQPSKESNDHTAATTSITSNIVGPSSRSINNSDPSATHSTNTLPEGWEMRSTPDGRVFYVDHKNKKTTWKDPRNMDNPALAVAVAVAGSSSEANANTGIASNPILGPLPPGWEERRTHDGRIFFVNHFDRVTQWEDPRHELRESTHTPAQAYARDYRTKLAYFRSKLRQREGKVDISVTRDNVFEDSFREVMKYSPDQLRKRLWIKFDGEDGLDYGGLAREWFYLLSHSMFAPYYGLFEYAASDIYTLQINPNSAINPDHLQYFEFIGRVVGMAVFHGKLIDAFFIPPFYRKIIGKSIEFDDLQTVDAEYYRSLAWIKDNDITDILDLDFTVDFDKFGVMQHIELKPDGNNIPVTEDNKLEYIKLIMEWRFSNTIEEQMEAFNHGFNAIIPQHLIKIFDEKELELLIGGLAEIDVQDWKNNTDYRNGYYGAHPVVMMFWEVVESFDNELRARLLQFVTGTSRVPVNGFRELHGSNGPQKFCLEKVAAKDGLCRAHTCFNRVDLPDYESVDLLKERLIFALENTQGFANE